MLQRHADQIARLLNDRNRLATTYSAESVLERADDILYEVEDGEVIGCIEAKKVQWYQWEIYHLSVAEGRTRRGIGTRLIARAEGRGSGAGARIVQCTIRAGNRESDGLFRKCGYRPVTVFYNPETGNDVAVYQKVLNSQIRSAAFPSAAELPTAERPVVAITSNSIFS